MRYDSAMKIINNGNAKINAGRIPSGTKGPGRNKGGAMIITEGQTRHLRHNGQHWTDVRGNKYTLDR